MSTTAGSIVVDLLARTGAFETDMDRASKTAKRRADEIDKALSAIGTAAATAGAAAAGALVLLINETTNAAREIQRQAQISNASSDAFQLMAAGARTVGIEQDKLADILKDVNDRVGDFIATGGGPMKDFFEQIAPKVGVTADQFARLSGPEALQLYVSSLEKAGVSQQEMTFYLEAMASDTTALIPLLANGGKEMARLGDEALRTGQVMSAETVSAAVELKGQMDQLGGQVQGAKNIIAGELIPTLSVAASGLISFGSGGDIARTAAEGLKFILQDLVISAREVAFFFEKAGKTIGARAAQWSAIFSGDFQGAVSISGWLKEDLAESERELNMFRAKVKSAGSGLVDSLGVGAIVPALPAVQRAGSGSRTSGGARSGGARSGQSEAEREMQRALQDGQRIYEQTRTAAEKLGIEFDNLNKLRELGAINQDTYNRAVFDAQANYDEMAARATGMAAEQERLNALIEATPTAQLEAQRETMMFLAQAFEQGRISAVQFEEAAVTALGNTAEKAIETGDVMTEFTKSAAEGMQRAFADFLFDPFKDGMDGMLKGFGQTLQRMIAEAVAADLANRMFGDMSGGKVGGWIGAAFSAIGGLFGGARASGGPVASNVAYLVGERGPELFVPNTAGAILPNSALSSGGGQTINLTVNVASGTPAEVRRAAGAGAREALAAFSQSQRYA
jgi:hypothetical protein